MRGHSSPVYPLALLPMSGTPVVMMTAPCDCGTWRVAARRRPCWRGGLAAGCRDGYRYVRLVELDAGAGGQRVR